MVVGTELGIIFPERMARFPISPQSRVPLHPLKIVHGLVEFGLIPFLREVPSCLTPCS
jgi:hypothetical protein